MIALGGLEQSRRSTIGSNAPSARIHMSGLLRTRFFFSLKEIRFQTLLPTYFSLVSTWCTVPRVHGRPRSVVTPRALSNAAISLSGRPSSTNARYIHRTVSHLFGRARHQDHPVGLDALLLAARRARPLQRRSGRSACGATRNPAGRPGGSPARSSRHWPAKTLADSSRLYSPAIARLTPLTMVETGLPSFSNCSAQYWTLMPARLQMYS